MGIHVARCSSQQRHRDVQLEQVMIVVGRWNSESNSLFNELPTETVATRRVRNLLGAP
jgi:hypothetical protein